MTLQPGWQVIAVSQASRQVIVMRRVPAAHGVALAVAVKMVPVTISIVVPVMISMKFFPVPIPVAPVLLGKTLCTAQSKHGCDKQV